MSVLVSSTKTEKKSTPSKENKKSTPSKGSSNLDKDLKALYQKLSERLSRLEDLIISKSIEKLANLPSSQSRFIQLKSHQLVLLVLTDLCHRPARQTLTSLLSCTKICLPRQPLGLSQHRRWILFTKLVCILHNICHQPMLVKKRVNYTGT